MRRPTRRFVDGPNGVRAGLWLSVGILAVASVVAAFQPEPAAIDDVHQPRDGTHRK